MRRFLFVLLILSSLLVFSAYKTIENRPGYIKWKLKIETSSNIAVRKNGIIYVVSHNSLYAINLDGTIKDSYSFSTGDDREMFSDPVIDDEGVIYIQVAEGGRDISTYAINPDGTYKHSTYRGYYTLGIDGSKYWINENGYLHSEGRFSWKLKINGYPRTRPSVGIDGTIYVGAGNRVYAFNPEGSLRWGVDLDYTVSSEEIAVGDDGTAYIGSERGLYAIDSKGHIKWKVETDDEIRHVPLIGDDGTIYFDVGNRVYAIGKDGNVKWDTKFDDDISFNLAMGVDGTIYAATTEYIYAITSSSKGLADSSWSKFHANQFNSRSIKTNRAVLVVNPIRLDHPLDVYINDEYIGKTPVVYKSDDTIDAAVMIKQNEKVVFEKHVQIPLKHIHGIFYPVLNKPPETPKILFPEASSVVSGSVSLSWRASADPDGDKVSYDLYFGISPNPPLVEKDLEDSSYTVIDLKPNTMYYWKVMAKDQYGLTSESSTMSFRTSSNGFVKWKVEIDGDPSGIAIGKDGTVYVSAYKQIKYNEYSGYVYAIDPNGSVKWKIKVDGRASLPIIGRNETVYVGAGSYIYAFNPDGVMKWKFEIRGKIPFSTGDYWNGSLAVGIDGTIYVESNECARFNNESCTGHIYAINPDGFVKWKITLDSKLTSSLIVGKDGTIYVGLNGSIHALNPDGTTKWKNRIIGSVLFLFAGRDGVVYAVIYDGSRCYVHAISPDGTVKWSIYLSLTRPVVGEDGTVYMRSCTSSNLYAIVNGSIRWKIKVENHKIAGLVMGKDGNIYVGSGNCICSVSPNGSINWKSKVGVFVKQYYDLTMADDGTIYLGGEKHIKGRSRYYIYAISTLSKGLADSPWPKFQSDQYNSGTVKTKKAVLAVNPGHSKDLDVFINGKYMGKNPMVYESEEPIDATVTVKQSGKILLERSVHVPTKRIYGILDTLFNKPPETPNLISPKMNSVISGNSVALSWKPSKDPDGDQVIYDLYFGTSTDLSPIATDLRGFSYRVKDLRANTTYYWKVVAKDSYGTSSESFGQFKTSSEGFVVRKIKLDRDVDSMALGKDGNIYIIADRYIYSLSHNGTVNWRTKIGDVFNSGLTVGRDGTIYTSIYGERFGFFSKYSYAISPDGSIKWEMSHDTTSDSVVSPKPFLEIDGTIYIVSGKDVYALDFRGFVKWKFQIESSVKYAPAVGMDGTIYIESYYGYIYALDPDGTLKWKLQTGDAVKSRLAIGEDGTIYMGSNDDNLYAIDSDGSVKWKRKISGGISSDPVIGKDGTVYIGSNKEFLYAIKPDGSTDWKIKTNGAPLNLIVGKDWTVYVGVKGGYIYAVTPKGDVRWKAEMGCTSDIGGVCSRWEEPEEVLCNPSMNLEEDGTIYMKCKNYIYAISTSSKGLADSPWPKPYADQFNSGVVRTKKAVLVVNPIRPDQPLDVYINGEYIGKTPVVYKSDKPINAVVTIKQDEIVIFEKHVQIPLKRVYGILDPMFNRPPEVPQNLFPEASSVVFGNVILSWESSDPDGDTVLYDLYFGTSPNPPLVEKDLESSSYETVELKANTTYYWKIVAKDLFGAVSESPVWSFKTSPHGFVKWKLKMDGNVNSITVGKDETIYVSVGDKLYAINPDGTVKWKIKFDDVIRSGPTIGKDETICVKVGDEIHVIDPDGSVKLKTKVHSPPSHTLPTASDGTVYKDAGDEIYAIDPNGCVKWSFKVEGVISTNIAIGKDGTVYVGSFNDDWKSSKYGGYFYAINPDGSLKWSYETRINMVYRYLKVAIGDDGTIYVVASNEFFYREETYAFSPDGTVKWRKYGDLLLSNPIIEKDGTFYSIFEGVLYVISANGKISWSFGYDIDIVVTAKSLSDACYIPGDFVKDSLVIGEDGTIYVRVVCLGEDIPSDYLYAVNSDGSVKWKFKTDGKITSRPVLRKDGAIYVIAGNRLYALNLDGSVKLNIRIHGKISSEPVTSEDGTIYFASGEYIYAISSPNVKGSR